MSTVIAFSGASGSGKSALIRALHIKLPDSTIVEFDHFNQTNRWYPEWLEPGGDRLSAAAEWRRAGCDPDRLVSTPGLIAALAETKGGLILLEEPFGRLRSELRSLINLSVHINTPLDISLTRKVLKEAEFRDPTEFLRMYLSTGLRNLYLTAQRAEEHADLVLDGMQPIEDSVEQAYAKCVGV